MAMRLELVSKPEHLHKRNGTSRPMNVALAICPHQVLADTHFCFAWPPEAARMAQLKLHPAEKTVPADRMRPIGLQLSWKTVHYTR